MQRAVPLAEDDSNSFGLWASNFKDRMISFAGMEYCVRNEGHDEKVKVWDLQKIGQWTVENASLET